MPEDLFDGIKGAFLGYIKGEEFEKGVVAKLLEKPCFAEVNDPKFGFKKDHAQYGKTIRYTFEVNGEKKLYETVAVRFKTALEETGAKVGDTLHITRSGSSFDTEWTMKKLKKTEIEAFAAAMGGEVVD